MGPLSFRIVKSASLFLTVIFNICAQESQTGNAPISSPHAQVFSNQPARLNSSSGQTWIDTLTRATVASSYLSTFIPSSSVLPGWVGSVANGNAGTTSQAYQNAVVLRINWFRQMAGLSPAISFLSSYSNEDQQAALMMSANGQLNHNPPSSWTNFTAAGADAAVHSNLCLEIPYLGDPGCIALYMQDYGANNSDVGHRRWLLYPQTQNMGTGDVQPPYPTPFANALWVIDSPHISDPRPTTRDSFIAWPPKGFVPYQLVPGRWSFSYPGADFTNATVTMQRSGSTVAVRLESPQQGYGENAVVWVPDNIDTAVSTSWPRPVVDTPITVTVSQVLVSGVSTSFTYTVTVFDPIDSLVISGHILKDGAGLAGVSVTLSGGTVATSDSNGAYQFGPLPPGTYLLTPSLSGFEFAPSSRSVTTATASADFTASSCYLSTSTSTSTGSASGGGSTFSLPVAAGCPWNAVSSASWLSFNPPSGIGPGNFTYSYPANHNLARTATITVAGVTLVLNQPTLGQRVPGPVVAAVFQKGTWAADSNGSGVFDTGDKYFNFQIYGAGDTPVFADWNGDGRTKAGIYSGGFWALDYNGDGQWNGAVIDKFYAFGGNPGEIPVVGDWNGDGRMKVGLYLNGFWILDYNGNGQWDGPLIDRFYAFGGRPAEIPVVGDWNGDGRTKVGSYAAGLWVLDYNGNGQWDGPVIDRYTTYTFGPGDKPVVGDWTGSGTTKIGVTKDGFWALDTNGNGTYESTDQFYAFGGNPGEIAIVGDWNGDGRSKVGIFLNGFWLLDYNGNGHWDGLGPGNDRFSAIGGTPGEKPVMGKW